MEATIHIQEGNMMNNYICSFNNIEKKAANEYCVTEIKPGEKYRVEFRSGKTYFMSVSDNYAELFGKKYYGVLLVVTDPQQEPVWFGRLFVRGNTVILCDKFGERYIVNLGENSDYFYSNLGSFEEERAMPEEDYNEILTRHFKKTYFEMWVEEPELWQKLFSAVREQVRPFEYDGGTLHIV